MEAVPKSERDVLNIAGKLGSISVSQQTTTPTMAIRSSPKHGIDGFTFTLRPPHGPQQTITCTKDDNTVEIPFILKSLVQDKKGPRLHLLVDLPRETRDHIWMCVFKSESQSLRLMLDSQASLQPRSKPHAYLEEVSFESHRVSLSFLRTCKQIHKECSNLLWKYNAVFLSPGQLNNSVFPVSMGSMPFRLIQSLRIEVFPPLLDHQHHVARDFGWLTRKTRNSSLQSITLIFAATIFGDQRGWCEALDRYTDILRNASGPGCVLANLERKIEIDNNTWKTPEPLLRKINIAFGGGLWVGNKLRYKDGVCVDTGSSE